MTSNNQRRFEFSETDKLGFVDGRLTWIKSGEICDITESMLKQIWRPVKEPVDFAVAFDAYMFGGKSIKCFVGTHEYTFANGNKDLHVFTPEQIGHGTWYIDD